MVHELVLESGSYISSKKAAEMSGYTQDYVGQLARSGQLDAKRIGGLWYVERESLARHKERADSYVPMPPPADARKQESEHILSFEGKMYISAAEASKVTGYNQDYVGQLARAGKILSRQVGNRWYVDSEGIQQHKREKDALLAAVQVEAVGLARPLHPVQKRATEVPSEPFYTYLAEEKLALPALKDKPQNNDGESASEKIQIKKVASEPVPKPLDASPISVIPPVRLVEHHNMVGGLRGHYRGSHRGGSRHKVARKQRAGRSVTLPSAVALLTVMIMLGFGIRTISGQGTFAHRSSMQSIRDIPVAANALDAIDTFTSYMETYFPLIEYSRNK